MTGVYGDAVCVKLRYLIIKFDVGKLEGGLQSGGQSAAKRLQLSQSMEAHEAHPEAWVWCKRGKKTGRISAPRVRIKVDQRTLINAQIGGMPAGKVIEKRVRMRKV